MESRISSGKKWTEFPGEVLEQITQVFTDNFASHLGNNKFQAEGWIYPKELLFRVSIVKNGQLANANFEVSITYNRSKENALKLIHLAVDSAASMVAQYFEDVDKADFPREWTSFTIEKKEIFLRFSTVNSELEMQADLLLGDNSDDLVKGEDDDDYKATITMLGLDEDDPDNDSDPDGTTH